MNHALIRSYNRRIDHLLIANYIATKGNHHTFIDVKDTVASLEGFP